MAKEALDIIQTIAREGCCTGWQCVSDRKGEVKTWKLKHSDGTNILVKSNDPLSQILKIEIFTPEGTCIREQGFLREKTVKGALPGTRFICEKRETSHPGQKVLTEYPGGCQPVYRYDF